MDKLLDLEAKISSAIDKVKALKGEKAVLEEKNSVLLARLKELEARIHEQDELLHDLSAEKSAVRVQLVELLNELETIEAG